MEVEIIIIGVFGTDGFEGFEENIGRFLSEYGMQSFPDIETIMKFAEEKI